MKDVKRTRQIVITRAMGPVNIGTEGKFSKGVTFEVHTGDLRVTIERTYRAHLLTTEVSVKTRLTMVPSGPNYVTATVTEPDGDMWAFSDTRVQDTPYRVALGPIEAGEQ